MYRAMTALFAVLVAVPVAAQSTIPVMLAPSLHAPQSGRLLVFAKRIEPGAKPEEAIDTSPFQPTGTAIAGRETWDWAPGEVAQVDGGVDAFPVSFATLPAGTYRFQAVLDRKDDYNYCGRGAGDLVSPVVEATLPGPMPMLTVATELPATTVEQRLASLPEGERAAMRAALAQVRSVDFVSPALSRFRGQPTSIRGWVALPPGYVAGGAKYPTIYSTSGFGGDLASAKMSAANAVRKMAEGVRPPMIWYSLIRAPRPARMNSPTRSTTARGDRR